MSNPWIINHDGLIIDYKDTTEGLINRPDGGRVYFVKLNDNSWKIVEFDSIEARDEKVISKINYAHSKAGTNRVNRYFMQVLEEEFPNSTRLITDSEIQNIFRVQTIYLSKKIKHESEQYAYTSEYEAVVVHGKRYVVGQTVHLNGNKYIVKKDGQGEGYLDLVNYPIGKGAIVTDEKRYTKEVVHYIDYSKGKVTSQAAGSDVFFDYTNGQVDKNGKSTIISNNKHVERRLRASKISEIRYWECVDFVPGYRAKTIISEDKFNTGEVRVSSKR